MSEHEIERWWAPAVSRRTLLRGGLLGGVGLAAAALIGCGGDDDDDDDDDATTATTSSGGSTTTTTTTQTTTSDDSDDGDDAATEDDGGDEPVGEGMYVKDDDLPYPYQFPEPAGLTPKPGGIMRIAATWNVATMDPTASAAGGTITAPNMVYNRLLGMVGGPRKNPFTIELEPELASSWERTPDGATFSFVIRDDIKWQNVAPLSGRQFTSADAKYAFDRYASEGVHQTYWANVSAIETPDDTSMTLQMSKVTADFILPLASRYQTIFPRELVENGTISDKVVGTGPMILEEAEAGSHAVFAKNPDYFEREVLLDGVEFRLRQDYTARLAGFRVGQFDYVYGLAPSIQQLGKILETNPDIQINLTPVVNGTSPFGMNLSNPKFADERVRQAITLGIDTALIAELLYDNISKTLPLQPWPYVFDEEPTVESGNLGRFVGRYDPDEALKLLKAAGAEGLEFENFYHNYSNPGSDQRAEIIAENLLKIGVKMDQHHVDYTEFNSTWVPGKLEEGCTSCWLTVGFDSDNFFYNSVHSESPGNRWKLNDPQVDAWAEAQQVELDPDARKEIQKTMWDYFLEKMYWPPQPASIGIEVYQPWLRGIRFGGVFLTNVSYYDWGDQIARAWLNK